MVENKLAPKIPPIAREIPSLSSPPAVKDVIISDAPLEKANKVTPANISDNLKVLAIFDIAGVK